MEFVPDAVVLIDDTGAIVAVNEQTEKMFGFSRDELVGRSVEVLMPENLRQRHVDHRGGYFHDPRSRTMGLGMKLLGLRHDGQEFPIDISLAPLNSQTGTVVAAFVRDMTERRRVDEKVAELTQAAHDAALERRHALELNDRVVQGLTVAFMALAIGENEQAKNTISATLEEARKIVSDLLGETGSDVEDGRLRLGEPSSPPDRT